MIFQAAVVNGREVYLYKPDSKADLSAFIGDLPTEWVELDLPDGVQFIPGCPSFGKAEAMIYDTDSSFAVCGYWGDPEKELFSRESGDAFSGCKISAFAENGSLFVDCYGKQNEIAWRICREELK